MRILLRLLLLLIVLALGAAGYVYVRATGYLEAPIGAAGQVRTVEIPKGSSFKAAVARLAEAGVVTDTLVFEGYARWQKATGVKAGTYAIDLGQTPRALLDQLNSGGLIPQVKVTIPEGLNKWEIADLLARKGMVSRAELLAQVDAAGLEGRLFPDTYLFREDATAAQIVERLTGRFDEVMAEVLTTEGLAEQYPEGSEARSRLLILASLVEKEARVDAERAIIARVFLNRIERGMKLQTDPTCVYGAEIYTQKPHPRYCKDPKSTYSTYVIKGMPPTPIASPGRAAIKAALRPAEDARSKTLLFFVARQDGSGSHEFSADYQDHVRAVNKYIRKR